jgi:uracil-DNA glycosylase family 4
MNSLPIVERLNEEIVNCRKCPRLVEWREHVAIEKRRQFQDDVYWGKPVPYFGDPEAKLLILGLAPAAHGANRTGRMFTGDRSGDFLYAALHRAGLANQPNSDHLGDGLELKGALIAASCHCAPPANKPTPEEISNCGGYLRRLLQVQEIQSVLCLGQIAWQQFFRIIGERPGAFGHNVLHRTSSGVRVIGSYHPSQQNTFTGKLTPEMLDAAVASWMSRD